MKKHFITLVAWAISTTVFCQINKVNTGQIFQEDFNEKYCPIDSTADAYVLNNIGEAFFAINDGSVQIYYYYYKKFKITSEAGMKYANIEIPYYNSKYTVDKVCDIKAISYNYENNILTKSELKEGDCMDKKVNDVWSMKKFAIPNVKPGTVIEYCYLVVSDYVFDFRDWEFQEELPVMNSKFTLRMIPFYEYSYILQGKKYNYKGYSYVDENNSRNLASINFKDNIFNFEMKDIPAFKDEEFITSKNDFITKIDFQLAKVIHLYGGSTNIITTWPELIKDLLSDENYGEYVKSSTKAGEKIFNLTTMNSLPPRQRFDSVISYVKSNFHWNGDYRLYATKKPKKLIDDNSGNSSEINLFTIGLLRSVGLTADPVIISTRNNGKIKGDYPFLNFFNNSLILVTCDSTNILTDATDPLLNNRRIPISCINDNGLIIKKKDVTWAELKSDGSSKIKTNINIDLLTSIVGLSVVSTDYDAIQMKKNIGYNTQKLKDQNKSYNIIDSTLIIRKETKNNSDYSYKFNFNTSLEQIANKIYLDPFFNEVISENPLKQETREYPIDMIYSKYKSYNAVIKIPEGYTISYVPKNRTINNSLFELSYTTNNFSDFLSISFYYQLKKPVYEPLDYHNLKNFLDDVVFYGNDKIVFTKEK